MRLCLSGLMAVAINLVRNYSPHLAPNTSTAPPTVELRRVLKLAATDMLKVYLRKWRLKRRKDEPDAKRVNEVRPVLICACIVVCGV